MACWPARCRRPAPSSLVTLALQPKYNHDAKDASVNRTNAANLRASRLRPTWSRWEKDWI